MRTPLTLIKGPLDLILESNQLNEAKRNAQIIDRNANRLLVLVNQLLDVNKLESNQMHVNNSVGYFDEFVNDLVFPFKNLARQKKIKFKASCNFKKLSLSFDADKVEKIIYNLLSNAFKFTHKNGEVTLSIDTLKADKKNFCKIKIVLTDTGIGISKKHNPNIFNRFYQVDNSSTRKADGTANNLLNSFLVFLPIE